jgi:hypothetical protein
MTTEDWWAIPHPCEECGTAIPGPYARCALCEAGAADAADGDDDATPYDPLDWGDWDTDEELPCLHADGCPGHRRCRVCI